MGRLKDIQRRQAVSNALVGGARVIQAAGKANLASTDLGTGKKGNLKNSFAIKLDRKKAIALAGFRRPKGAAAHLVDRGTKARYTRRGYYRGTVRKSGPYTGSMFWTDAVHDNGGTAVQRIIEAVYDEIDRLTKGGI